jgi:hypothetical protein
MVDDRLPAVDRLEVMAEARLIVVSWQLLSLKDPSWIFKAERAENAAGQQTRREIDGLPPMCRHQTRANRRL